MTWAATEWLARTAAPAWLRACQFTVYAATLEALDEVTADTADVAQCLLEHVLDEVRSYRQKTGARVATPAAAVANWAMQESGVYTARWDAWRPGDWAKCREAAWHICHEAAWVTAWLASEEVPAFATSDGATYYWEGRADAARAALAPTVAELQPT